VIVGLVAVVVALGTFLVARASGRINKIALASSPRPVTVVQAEGATYRPEAHYVGTIAPWVEARVGPQFVSAYVDTVVVRPGDAVTRGQVVATLDCRNVMAESSAVSMHARALETRNEALAHEAARVGDLLQGGFVSPNEAEQKSAESASKEAELQAARARLARSNLEVGDCVLRAPFDGEVAQRMMDPGAFARPGTPLLTLVDRSRVRVTANAPERDFAAVGRGAKVRVRVLSTDQALEGPIARRSPSADPGTRTIHFEVDFPNTDRRIPVYATADLAIDVGEPTPATRVPLSAASVRGSRATLFVLDGSVARKRTLDVRGEAHGSLFLDSALPAGSRVVTEGRAQLRDGDAVTASVLPPPTAAPRKD
jgi:RND family efflux transporter MFP subunit